MTQLSETIARFEHGGDTYEIDHLGIGRDSQWGEFVVYSDDLMVATFAIPEAGLKAEYRPAELPVAKRELIRLAKEALAETTPGGAR